MNQDPFEKDPLLKQKLDEYHVEVPDFPDKPSPWERFIRLLGSPAKDPLENMVTTTNGFLLLKVIPLTATIIIGLIQALLFL
ncbi:hypothetical protein [Salinibacillus xinjiangensis]|uniref:Uncharacterized protein n=1 Tax=Salinibacillus xinjiangensis TaxID=1229268 RepID=A0A6G1X415_9BACI|nr:hypothetical protein [Salinibacillus xinjiangensis]MRG85731.1 hypothetical protein [Salinibacillus xinjiangensis]